MITAISQFVLKIFLPIGAYFVSRFFKGKEFESNYYAHIAKFESDTGESLQVHDTVRKQIDKIKKQSNSE